MSGNEIVVLCTLGLAGVMKELGPKFERENDCRLAIEFGPAARLSQDIAAGAAFDVAVLTAAAVDAMIATGKIAPGTRTDIAQSCVGVTVQPGATKPDISTVEAFKRALLAAKSVMFTVQGASGQHFASILPKLGIEHEVRAKTTMGHGLVAEHVVRGEIELGIQQVSEILAVPGAVLVGPIPEEVQSYTVFSAGLGATARNLVGAKALLARLADAETAALATARGLETVTRARAAE